MDRHPVELACRRRGNRRSAPSASARLSLELLLDHMGATLATMVMALALALTAGTVV